MAVELNCIWKPSCASKTHVFVFEAECDEKVMSFAEKSAWTVQ